MQKTKNVAIAGSELVESLLAIYLRLRKKIEKWFSEKHPDKWTPLYNRITFSEEPYVDALREGDRQALIMNTVMAVENIAAR